LSTTAPELLNIIFDASIPELMFCQPAPDVVVLRSVGGVCGPRMNAVSKFACSAATRSRAGGVVGGRVLFVPEVSRRTATMQVMTPTSAMKSNSERFSAPMKLNAPADADPKRAFTFYDRPG